MADGWYYRQGTTELGPVSLVVLTQLVRSGELAPNHWVRKGEGNPWRPVSKTPQLSAPIPATTPAPKRTAPRTMGTPAPQPTVRPAAAPPPPRAIAQGASASVSAPPEVTPVSFITAPAKDEKTGKGADQNERRKKSSPNMTVGLSIGGVLAIVALGIVGALASMGGSDGELSVAADGAAPDSVEQVASESKSTRLSATQSNMVKSIKTWREPVKRGGLKDLISFEVQRVYWSDATTGSRLRVEIAVGNVSPSKLTYHSWNGKGKSGAWLVDSDLKLVAFAAGTGKSQQLAPKQSIVETLEFATEKKDFEELRLVLPYAAVARAGQWGYLLDAATLSGSPKKTAASHSLLAESPLRARAATSAAAPEPLIIQPVEGDAAPGIAAKAAPMLDEDGNPKEDLRDQIRRSIEQEKLLAPPADK